MAMLPSALQHIPVWKINYPIAMRLVPLEVPLINLIISSPVEFTFSVDNIILECASKFANLRYKWTIAFFFAVIELTNILNVLLRVYVFTKPVH